MAVQESAAQLSMTLKVQEYPTLKVRTASRLVSSLCFLRGQGVSRGRSPSTARVVGAGGGVRRGWLGWGWGRGRGAGGGVRNGRRRRGRGRG